MNKQLIPALITIAGLLISFPILRYFYIQGRKDAKGKFAPNIRRRKITEIISFDTWYNEKQEEIEDTWRVTGMYKVYTLDEFALELFKGNPLVTSKIDMI